MGNCWLKPVDNLPTTTITRPTTSAHGHPRHTTAAAATDQGGGGEAEVRVGGKIVMPSLKMFTLAELTSATRNFRPDGVLGGGGFGRAFLGYVDEKTLAPSNAAGGIPVTVNRSDPNSEQVLKEWQAEVKLLGKLSHPNIVKLLGYCREERQFLLVYEYMPNGTLESHLFSKGSRETIAWKTRMKIAIGAAKGLVFLHNTKNQVILRDFKASNIFLDSDFNAKLSNFGFAKSGPDNGNAHVTTKVVAPEYMARAGPLYIKSDIYGFGVVLLEMVTGQRVFDPKRPKGQTYLVNWARPLLLEKQKLSTLMDPRLQGQYPSKAACGVAELIHECLQPNPKLRPNMDEVVYTLERMNKIQTKKPKETSQQIVGPYRHSDNWAHVVGNRYHNFCKMARIF